MPAVLKEYHVAAVTPDTDALGEVSVLVELDGRLASGQGVSTDTLEASARAYLRGALERARRRDDAGAASEVAGRAEPATELQTAERCQTRTPATSPGRDGERLIRFGEGALAEAREPARGARASSRYALLTHRAGAQRRARAGRSGRRSCSTCRRARARRRGGRARRSVEGSPLVALGGGRVIDSAKAIAGADGLRVRGDPDHALGRGDDAVPPHAGGRRRVEARAPGARDRRSRR